MKFVPRSVEDAEPFNDFFVSIVARTSGPDGMGEFLLRGGKAGASDLSFANDRDGDRRRKSDPSTTIEIPSPKQRPGKRGHSPEVGSALRSVYQHTVDETIPAEMLDLLGKLR